MSNAKYLLLCLALVSSLSFADESERSVNIDIRPSTAEQVSTHSHDPRLGQLSKQKDRDDAKRALETHKSYVSRAPDPNDPNYWKIKNSVSPLSREQGEVTQGISDQDLQRQTMGLQKILQKMNKSDASANNFHSVAFADPSQLTASSAEHSKLTNSDIKQALALPGTVWYATMASAADSYVPGPVTGEIEEGPFAGGKVVGKFEVAPDGEHLILSYQMLSFKGRTYPISAVAMDPNTKISGVTGNIDHHFFTRFIIPGAASFLEQVTDALMNQNQQVTTNDSSTVISNGKLNNTQLGLMGASGAAKTIASATRPQGVLRLPQVHIKAGTGFGFLVLQPILSTGDNS